MAAEFAQVSSSATVTVAVVGMTELRLVALAICAQKFCDGHSRLFGLEFLTLKCVFNAVSRDLPAAAINGRGFESFSIFAFKSTSSSQFAMP